MKKVMIIAVILLLCAVLVISGIAIANIASVNTNRKFIKRVKAVEYDNQLVPSVDDDGYYTFTTDDDFKVMQLTDIHISGGFLSTKKDNMALNAVAAMVSEEKPDLVIVTGDIGFPAPDKSGTFNNKSGAGLFADLMEQLGVYWAPVYGNHDTESYSYYTREDISAFYGNREKFPHSLFQNGPENIDGCGNYIIKVKNSKGEITQALVLMDSNSYVKKTADQQGCYDNVHKNQVAWYENEIGKLKTENNGTLPSSLAFFHIPVPEYQTAWDEYVNNGRKDTENVKYKYGNLYEDVCTTLYNSGFFSKAKELGSTKAIFCGHDHINNFYLEYQGIGLVYSYAIDYLAYEDIEEKGLQRGCTIINLKPDGLFESHLENYYQDKYKPINPKEKVNMTDAVYD